MDLNFCESQERQGREGDRSEIGIVVGFDDLPIPCSSVERIPDLLELPTQPPERSDDLFGVFPRTRSERFWSLRCTTTRVIGRSFACDVGLRHAKERFASETEMAGDGQSSPVWKQGRLQ